MVKHTLVARDSFDDVAFLEALMACAIATRAELMDGTIEVYARTLRDLPWTALTVALTRAAKECEFFPSVARLRAMAEEGLEGPVPGVAATQALLDSHGRPELVRDGEGRWQTHAVPGLGTITLRVLPDDHQALPHYHCLHCHDSGWSTTTRTDFGRTSDAVERCFCYTRNPVLEARRDRVRARRAHAETA